MCVSCNNGPGGGCEVLLSFMYSAHGQEHSWGRRHAGIRKGPWVLPSRDGEILGWKSLSPAQSLSLSLSSFFTGLSILWVTKAFSEAFILLIYCFNIVGLKVLTSKNSSQVPLFSDWSHLQFASNCPGFSDCKMKIWEFHSQFFKSSRHSTTFNKSTAALALSWDQCIFRSLSVFQKQLQCVGGSEPAVIHCMCHCLF